MTEYRLRVCLGFYIIICQLWMISLATYYLVSGGFLFTQYTTILGLVIPLFAGYISIIIKFFTSKKYVSNLAQYDQKISIPFSIMSFIFPTLLAIAVGGCIYAAAFNLVFRNFEDVKIAIGLAQGAFGIYVGQFIYSLFDEASRAAAPRKRSN